jgi:hypothetical protein
MAGSVDVASCKLLSGASEIDVDLMCDGGKRYFKDLGYYINNQLEIQMPSGFLSARGRMSVDHNLSQLTTCPFFTIHKSKINDNHHDDRHDAPPPSTTPTPPP